MPLLKIIGHFKRERTPTIHIRVGKKSLQLTLDTGFDGELCLNKKTLKKWGFTFKGTEGVELADGSLVGCKIYTGTIPWFGKTRRVLAHETSSLESLIGMGLLQEVRMTIDVKKRFILLEKTPGSAPT